MAVKIAPYAFKALLDEFVYYHSLPAPLRPLVYRTRNSERLVSERANDKSGRPLVPRVFPGTPSAKRTAEFISHLDRREELDHFRTTLTGLTNIEIKSKKTNTKTPWMKPSVVNAFLYKSFQLGTLGSGLNYIDSLGNYKWSPRNVEAITLIRYMQISRDSSKYTRGWFEEKQASLRTRAALPEFGSALLNVVELACQLRLGAANEATVARCREVAAKFPQGTTSSEYVNEDHAYSIIMALKEASLGSNSGEIVAIVSQFEPYLAAVEALKKDTPSTLQQLQQ